MFVKLRVHPSSRKDALVRQAPDLYEIWVRAPAQEGRANKASLGLLAASLKIPAGRIRLIKGGKSPSKIVEIP